MTEEEEEKRAKRQRRRRQAVIQFLQWWFALQVAAQRDKRSVKEHVMSKRETVREMTVVNSEQIHFQMGPAHTGAGGQDEMQKAFNDLLSSVSLVERRMILNDVERQRLGAVKRPTIIDTPEARAMARRSFNF